MKAALIVEGDRMNIILTPESKGERHIIKLVGEHQVGQVYATPTGEGPGQNAIVLALGKE